MPFSLHDILFDIVLPCAISLALLLLGQLVFWKKIDPFNRWIPPLALSVAAAVGIGFVLDWPKFPPPSSTGWIAYAALAAMPAAVSIILLQRWFALRAAIAIALLALITWLLMGMGANMTMPSKLVWIDVGKTVAAAVAFWFLLDGLAARTTGVGLPLVLMFSAAACAVIMMLSNSLQLGLAYCALAAATGPLFLVACWARLFSIGRAGALAFALLYCAILINARFLLANSLPQPSALILLLAPLLAWIAEVPGINRLPNAWRVPLQILFPLAALGYVVVPAWIAFKNAGGAG